jgi:hypothetical protein
LNQDATLERDQANAEKLGELKRAVRATEPPSNVVPIGR